MSKLQEYIERVEELRATDRDPELFGMDEPPRFQTRPVDELDGVYKKLVMRAYQLNKPLRYIDIVELLVTGKVGVWDSKKRTDYRGHGAINLQGYGRGKRGILQKWFVKDLDGKYIPKPHLREDVLMGNFKPFGGQPRSSSGSYEIQRAKRLREAAKERDVEKLKGRWS